MKTITWNDYHNEYHPYYTLAGRTLSRLDIIESVVSKHTDLLDKELHVKT